MGDDSDEPRPQLTSDTLSHTAPEFGKPNRSISVYSLLSSLINVPLCCLKSLFMRFFVGWALAACSIFFRILTVSQPGYRVVTSQQ